MIKIDMKINYGFRIWVDGTALYLH